ncbi:hypothetical protein SAMN05216428_12312 [Nitrosospira sp. Nsp11]|uniref:hypothetical protein n=1 Tax=Nitrosospira sp. Nsp11 TaxID=1855338 RepID=UPI00091886E6|nr:hypothetical protein [Nitrosospira sp. Nsp11]SHM30421.1 hypothetical protein SAMN05216428_12312 [Nitrosospira sp. Nsp11]
MRKSERKPSNILARPGDVEQNPEQIYMCTPDNPFGRVIPELHQGPEILINDTELAARTDDASKELQTILGLPGNVANAFVISYLIKAFLKANPRLALGVALASVILKYSLPILTATYGSKNKLDSTNFVIPKEYKESGLGNVTIKEHGDRMNNFIETREWKENTGQLATMEA